VVVASILLVPFHITLNLANQGFKYNGYMQVRWLKIRIIKREIPPEKQEEEKQEEEKQEEEKQEKDEKPRAQWNLDRIVKVFNLFLEALPHFERIFRAMIRSVDLERFLLDLKFGLDSPVDTAEILGIFWSMASIINLIPKITLNMRPVFMQPTFGGKIELEFKIKLFWIVIESLRAITKKPVRNLIKEVRA
jgi:hypothetical protein